MESITKDSEEKDPKRLKTVPEEPVKDSTSSNLTDILENNNNNNTKVVNNTISSLSTDNSQKKYTMPTGYSKAVEWVSW